MNFIDTHCHLVDDKFLDTKAVIERAKRVGVTKLIMPTSNLEEASRAVLLAESEKQFCLAGIHPEEVENYTNPGFQKTATHGARTHDFRREDEAVDKVMTELKKIIETSDRVVGVGEIGLDFYWDKEKKTENEQIELFRKQMELAIKLDLPAVIHMREAETQMIEELQKMKNVPSGQFHCFAGSEEFLRLVLDLGFYISFCGNITYKSAGNLRDLLHQVPLNRLLLETDSPYLSPEPLRGTVNEPANVKIIGEFISKELNIELSRLAEITTENALCLYSLDI